MHVPEERREFTDHVWRILLEDQSMTDVEIEPKPGGTAEPAIEREQIQAELALLELICSAALKRPSSGINLN
jgi:hypothetical protein